MPSIKKNKQAMPANTSMKRVSPDIAAQLFPTARPDCGYFVSQSGKILMNKHAPPLTLVYSSATVGANSLRATRSRVRT